LREHTFREVGEGTGRVIDLDAFDLFYEHLFVWDTYTRTITGAYRLADVDALRSEGCALYTESLFDYEPPSSTASAPRWSSGAPSCEPGRAHAGVALARDRRLARPTP